MDRERMKMAILEQEQTFRQQVHEMHRVYHVQKHLMREMQTAGQSRAHTETKPKLDVWRNEKATNCQKSYGGFSDSCTPASAEECNLELTLATGSSSSRKSGRAQKGKQVMKSSDSDSGTAVSSTSTESELAQFKDFDTTAAARFQSEINRFTISDEKNQPPWPTQSVGLRMAW